MAAAWLMVELTGSSLPRGAGADGRVPADVPAGAAGRRAGRHHRPAAPDPRGAAGAGRCRRAARGAAARPAGPGRRRCCCFVFVAGCCTALLSPAWNSTVADAVPRDELPQAITAIGIAYNAARALGPALAGVVFRGRRRLELRRLPSSARWCMAQAIRRWPPRAASAVAAAGRAPVGRHAERPALRAALAGGAGAAGAHRRLQRRGLGAVGAAAGDRPAPARAGRRRLRPADGLPGHRRRRRRPGARPHARAPRAGARWSPVGCVRLRRGDAGRRRSCAGRWLVYVALALAGRRLDGGDVDLQHRHADQRAALGARARASRCTRLCALGLVRDRLGVLGRAVGPVRAGAPRCRSRPRCMAVGHAAGAPFPAAHGRGLGGDARSHAVGRLRHRRRARARGRPGGGRDRLPHPRRARRPPSWTRPASCARRAAATARPSGASTATWPTRRATSSASSSPPGPTTCTSAPAPPWPTRNSRPRVRAFLRRARR